MIFKISTKNRASIVSGSGIAEVPWAQMLDDFNYDVRFIAGAQLPSRLRDGAIICDKWCLKARKLADSDEDAIQEGKLPSSKKGNGCFSFAWGDKCKYGDKCFGVHSIQAKCPNGPTCKFFASTNGCVFKGADSHDP